MKKNAFSLTELLAVIIILGIISLVAVISYTRHVRGAEEDSYTQGEETMRAAAESFMTYCATSTINLPASCPQFPLTSSNIRIELTDLVNEGFMDAIIDQEAAGTCDGYVIINNQSEAGDVNYDFCYEVHLNCSEYQTDSEKWSCN